MYCFPFSDPRVSEYPFMDRPFLNFFGTLTYLFVVLYAGPQYMKDRPAFNLRKWVVIYNIAMVVFSTYIFYEVCFKNTKSTEDFQKKN